jgi:hypothetical protein
MNEGVEMGKLGFSHLNDANTKTQRRTLGEEFHHFEKENGHEKGDKYLTYLLRVLET